MFAVVHTTPFQRMRSGVTMPVFLNAFARKVGRAVPGGLSVTEESDVQPKKARSPKYAIRELLISTAVKPGLLMYANASYSMVVTVLIAKRTCVTVSQ